MTEEDKRKQGFELLQDTWQSGPNWGDLKGNEDRDAQARQVPVKHARMNDKHKTALYENDALAAAIADNMAEDMTREWLNVEVPNDETFGRTIDDHLGRLDARSKFQDMIRYEIVYGDGYISIGVDDDRDNDQPVDDVDAVQYLHAFSQKKVSEQDLVEDPFSPDYGSYSMYHINAPATSDEIEIKAHPDRMIHYQTRRTEDEDWGRSAYQRYKQLFQYFDNASWSLGQVLYQLVFKVYKTDLEQMDDEKEEKIKGRLEKAWTQGTLAIIDSGGDGEGEESIEIPSTSQNVSGLEDMLEFLKDQVSMATRIPKSVLFGAQSGTLSASETDAMSYFNRIKGLQETYLREKVAKLVRYLMKQEDRDPDSFEWEINFNPLWSLDQMTESEIAFNTAKAASLLAQSGVMPVDEIRERYFEKEPIQPKTPEEEEDTTGWYKEKVD